MLNFLKSKKIAHIIFDKHSETKKWLISNIDGWKATSLFDDEDIINMDCYKGNAEKKIVWVVEFMDYPSFKIIIKQDNTVEVRYIFDDGREKLIDHNLQIRTYHLKKLKEDDNKCYKHSELFIYSAKYKNVIGKYICKTGRDQIAVQLHPFLCHLTPNNDGKIYPYWSSCYKLIPELVEQKYDMPENVRLLTSDIARLYLN